MGDLITVRRELRMRRKAIIGIERIQKSQAAALQALRFIKALEKAQYIGVFLSLPEEIDTSALIEALWQCGKTVYLPVVVSANQALIWREYHSKTVLQTDSFGILTPSVASEIAPSALDVVVMPLVGFDLCGQRIGMGGGFYDRTFADKIPAQAPWLLGLAYECQAVKYIQRRDWDVPMDALATEAQLLHFI